MTVSQVAVAQVAQVARPMDRPKFVVSMGP